MLCGINHRTDELTYCIPGPAQCKWFREVMMLVAGQNLYSPVAASTILGSMLPSEDGMNCPATNVIARLNQLRCASRESIFQVCRSKS